jgi:hypothetical protein
MTDSFVPQVSSELLALALRATPLAPVVKRLPGLSAGEGVLEDLLGRSGATRAFVQFRSTQHEDGHFVLFHEPGAAEMAMEFMRARVRSL